MNIFLFFFLMTYYDDSACLQKNRTTYIIHHAFVHVGHTVSGSGKMPWDAINIMLNTAMY